MATQKSKYLSDILLSWEAGITAPAAPANLYLALLTTMPTNNTGSGLVEVSGGSYVREQITPAQWAAIVTNADTVTEQSSTNVTVTFPTATVAWGTIVGVAEYDALSAGNLLRYDPIASQVIGIGNTLTFAIGAITRSEN